MDRDAGSTEHGRRIQGQSVRLQPHRKRLERALETPHDARSREAVVEESQLTIGSAHTPGFSNRGDGVRRRAKDKCCYYDIEGAVGKRQARTIRMVQLDSAIESGGTLTRELQHLAGDIDCRDMCV